MATALTSATPRTRRWFMEQNGFTAIILAVASFSFVEWVLGRDGGFLPSIGWEVNQIMFLAYLSAIFFFFLGLGYFNYPISWLLGNQPSREYAEYEYGIVGSPVKKYFRLCLDHKVIGIQYFVAVIGLFMVGGFNAMLIRTELLTPHAKFVDPGVYLTHVGEHSVMMLLVTSSAIIGPFGNYFVPLMIGAKRMAFPRIEALSFWLFLLSAFVLLSGYLFGGFPTGWTGYAPLADEAHAGMNSYIVTFALVGASMSVSGINLIATVLMMRAPGMTWSRMTVTVWSVIVGSILAWLAAPILIAVLTMVAIDRSFLTGFFIPLQGGSAFLYENIFWTFGHPEVYILAVPAMGIVLDIVAVFARRAIWGYTAAVTSMFGIGLLSWFVWQHHLFVSGLTPGLRPFFMFTTEMISFPTGIIFLAGLGTLWGARIQFTTAMLFALAWFPNFLLGGFSGIFLSDVPADVQLHGSYFVQAHFHFVLMGATFFAVFAAAYY
ncbi:MAG: cytochrome c oxidase subunit I, partial [Chloroflexota bacterium]